ncbi:glycosyltransferase family 10 domain-containing protein [Scleromatobacter humisilvae]|uniref:Glycosyltransferase family 10 n=1 Tax=Scleromatobacter humisilvae TaxID=2897159 RepID=A0A9X2BZU9_9BURK|nr:glycosyltransferase family 10 [Scleromatobacter humisilvae]MCK9687078.1 glycosyltransferase family 10 [Scleromatobacter humisilvae]
MSGPETAILAPMRYATLVVDRLRANAPFRADGRDVLLPWRQLRDRFAVEGVELNTRDVNADREVEFELHLDAQRRVGHPLSYAYLHEDAIVRPINGNLVELARYRKLFTSNEALIDHDHVVALDHPNDLAPRDVPDFKERDLFCVLVASNDALPRPDPRSLQQRRIEAIRYFEVQAPDRFALFGAGWDVPAAEPGPLGRVTRRVNEWRRRLAPDAPAAFPSWRGKVDHKHEVLDRARFSICYEDSRGSPGYLSGKIFDCLTSGCVPVYIGTAHSRPPIPEDCFIDGDQFRTPNEMLAFIERIDAGHFAMYQQGIREFLASAEAQRFTNAHWCETLVTRILADVQQA